MKIRFFNVVLFCFLAVSLSAQETFPKYGKPVDIPIYLSATFAELRPNHLHSGIDIKTQGVEGKAVYAVADGYVSRIGVSPYGYGLALYITHYDGYTSVYGHLQRFSPNIAKYVKNYQYSHKTFTSQIYPPKDKFQVKKGDLIAYSGNSGGSGGPHLHFEIRHTDSEKPVNPLYFGYKIADDVKPKIIGAAVYLVGETTIEEKIDPMYFSLSGDNGKYALKDRKYVHANGEVAFGVCAYDQVGTSPNKNGPYLYELYLDGTLAYQVECDSFSFDEQRYVNSLLDYRHYKEKKSSYVRTEVDPFNKISVISRKNGIVEVTEGDTVAVTFKIIDYAGNASTLSFSLVGTAPVEVELPSHRRSEYFVKADGSMNASVEIEAFSVKTTKGTFFRDEWVQTGQRDRSDCCSRIYRFGDEGLAVFKNVTVSITPDEKWKKQKGLFIASIGKDGKVSSLGGSMKEGRMVTETRTLGEYAIMVDSIAPKVTASNFKTGQSIKELNSLRFKISDDMTGIDSYNIYLNDEWVLGKYDAKNNFLYYEFDEHLPAGNINVKVVVKDAVGNEKTLKAKVVN